MNNEKILAVPTNVITGFLGVGKTSAIVNLLKQKPEQERWAVLVNEFGEIGVDGHLLAGKSHKYSNVFIKELTGGCMCCTSGLPMQIALNQLLIEARPHRLLIEPTGLGHPHEVLQLLSNQYYQEILSLEKTLTLVDARNLSDRRYTAHDTFNQQLEIADVIIGNKVDLYRNQDKQVLHNYLSVHDLKPDNIYFTEHALVKLPWLAGKIQYKTGKIQQAHNTTKQNNIEPSPIPKSGFIKAINQGEGYKSIGWRIAPDQIFDRPKLIKFITNVKAIRLKAVFITTDGIFGYNNSKDGLNEMILDECTESRIEIICDVIDDAWDILLKQAMSP